LEEGGEMRGLYVFGLILVGVLVAAYGLTYVVFAPILVIFNDSGNVPGPGSVALLVVKELLPLLVLVWVVAVIITVVRENRSPKKSLPNREP
jgi:hypothetical protein